MNALQKLRGAIDATVRAAAPTWRERLATPRARLVLGAVALTLIAGGFFLFRPPQVTVAQPTRGEAVDVVYATGVVDYVRQARLAPVATAPIQRVFVEEAQRVRGGALLAQLDDGPARGTAAQLEAQASTARLAAQRVQTLYQRGFASRAAWDEARGARAAAEAAARSARERLDDYAIRAPFAGTILRRDAEPGDLATPNRVLFVLADEASLRVTADLDERDIARVAVDQAALVRADAFPNQTFDATIGEVTPQGDSATRVFRVRLRLDPTSPLRAGMTVEANIVAGRRENAVLVPAGAVRDNAVFVVEGSRVRRRPVVVGAVGDQRSEIQDGLSGEERVIVNPPEGLRDGQRVRVRDAGAAE